MSKPYILLTEDEFKKLDSIGLLYELYPECSHSTYEEFKADITFHTLDKWINHPDFELICTKWCEFVVTKELESKQPLLANPDVVAKVICYCATVNSAHNFVRIYSNAKTMCEIICKRQDLVEPALK